MSENPLDLFDGAEKPDLTVFDGDNMETVENTRERPNTVEPENAVETGNSVDSINAVDSVPETVDTDDFRHKDSLLMDDKALAVFKQSENTLMWNILDLYDDNGNIRSKNQLRKNPPILSLESSDGSQAEFVLTEGLSKSLSELLEIVYYAYNGVEKKRPLSLDLSEDGFKGVLDRFKNSVSEHPVRVGFLFSAIILAILMLVLL